MESDQPNVQLVYELRDDANSQAVRARNIRESPLDLLFQRKVINQDQFTWGERYRRDWELAQIGSISSPDLGRVKMDTKGGYRGLSDARLDTLQRLQMVTERLSRIGRLLLDLVCVEGHLLKTVAHRMNIGPQYVGYRFKEALDELGMAYEDYEAWRDERRPEKRRPVYHPFPMDAATISI